MSIWVFQIDPFRSFFESATVSVLRWTPSNSVIIVPIDSKSLDTFWWSDTRTLAIPKSIYLKVLKNILNDGAKSVWFDIVFQNNDPTEPEFAKFVNEHKNVFIAAKLWYEWTAVEQIPNRSFSGSRIWFSDVLLNGWYSDIVSKYPINVRANPSLPLGASVALLQSLSGTVNMIPFFSEPWQFPKWPNISDIFFNNFSKWSFSWKTVLIGEYSTVIDDSYFSPVSSSIKMPWVEFHANIAESFISRRFISELSSKDYFFIFWSLLFSIILLSGYISILLWAVWFIASIFILLIIARIAYMSWYFIDISQYPIFGIIILFSVFWFKWIVVDRQNRFIMKWLSMFVSHDIAEKAIGWYDFSVPFWDSKEIAVFFSDIAGFTTISEWIDSQKLFIFMNEYLSTMSSINIKNHWFVDKFIGDAIMAIYGNFSYENSACDDACLSAIEQISILKKFAMDHLPENIRDSFSIRIWIHFWVGTVGNVGWKEKINYTAFWDVVNTASRMEWANKNYWTSIIATWEVISKIQNSKKIKYRLIDSIILKWKLNPVDVYEIFSPEEQKIDIHEIISIISQKKYGEALSVLKSFQIWDIDSVIACHIHRIESMSLSGFSPYDESTWAFVSSEK